MRVQISRDWFVSLPTPQNYGLFLRANISAAPGQRAQLTLLQAVAIRGMNIQPTPMDPGNARIRLNYLNELNAQQLGGAAPRFDIQPDGTGLYRVQVPSMR